MLELRLHDDAIETLAWRDTAGAIAVDTEALLTLGLAAPDPAAARTRLDSVPSLSYRVDEAQGAVTLTCAAACFAPTTLNARNEERSAVDNSSSGGFLNLDLAATAVEGAFETRGLFELALFNSVGAGANAWTADADGQVTRLETYWTIARPQHRTMLRLGDSITRGGAGAPPFRFGGVQFATDFSLDPGFITYPTPTLRGEAAAPSTIDVYVDGALRLRSAVDAGPFSIPDAPVLTGAGVAQIVVRDALGREQVFAQPFYAGPSLLRPGLADFSFALGAERKRFALDSADYGRSFATGLYRRGLTSWLTAEARAEHAPEHSAFAAAASLSAAQLGQVDLAFSANGGAREGESYRAAWSRLSRVTSFSLELSGGSAGARRLGQDFEIDPPRLQTSAAFGVDLQRLGAASVAYTERSGRNADDVRTLALSYSPRITRRGSLNLSAFYVDDDREPYLTLGVGYGLSFDNGAGIGAGVSARGGRLSVNADAQRAPDQAGGVGWRAAASAGELNRIDASVMHLGSRSEARIDLSQAGNSAGLRGQYAAGLAWIDGQFMASRPIRDSFALVEAGAANVTVSRDRRPAGRTNADGRLLLTGLRPYEPNRISLTLEELPLEVQPRTEEIEVTPAARGGVVARFPGAHGAYGEARVLSRDGAPLAPGVILVSSEGDRTAVGTDGRIYIAGLRGAKRFTASAGCDVTIAPSDLNARAPLRCEP